MSAWNFCRQLLISLEKRVKALTTGRTDGRCFGRIRRSNFSSLFVFFLLLSFFCAGKKTEQAFARSLFQFWFVFQTLLLARENSIQTRPVEKKVLLNLESAIIQRRNKEVSVAQFTVKILYYILYPFFLVWLLINSFFKKIFKYGQETNVQRFLEFLNTHGKIDDRVGKWMWMWKHAW